MISLATLLASMLSILQSNPLCERVESIETDPFATDRFAFKVRARIISKYSLQIRIYYNRGHYDYSYQLFSDVPIVRCDNKEHFPNLATYPHHYHNEHGRPAPSPLSGNPETDLPLVLEKLGQLLDKIDNF